MSYFNEVITEAKRTEWPKGKELTDMTLSVIQVCAIFAVIFILMDVIINFVLRGLGA